MNYEQTKEAIKVMQHYVDGGEIEHRDRPTSCSRKWHPLIDPYWDWSTTEYRIKPKPLEAWAVTGGEYGFIVCADRKDAEANLTLDGRIVHMREVTECTPPASSA